MEYIHTGLGVGIHKFSFSFNIIKEHFNFSFVIWSWLLHGDDGVSMVQAVAFSSYIFSFAPPKVAGKV